ncbi:antirestriction protein ArdC, partial [Novosphingobium sp. SG707]|nr:antirestriction protein ArdC [Novosphingobium sp. SG707]
EQSLSDNGGIGRVLGVEAAFLHIIDTSRLLEVLREDNRAIFRAASQASKAADWLLARHAEYRVSKDSRDSEDNRDTPQSEPAEPEQGSMTEGRAAA